MAGPRQPPAAICMRVAAAYRAVAQEGLRRPASCYSTDTLPPDTGAHYPPAMPPASSADKKRPSALPYSERTSVVPQCGTRRGPSPDPVSGTAGIRGAGAALRCPGQLTPQPFPPQPLPPPLSPLLPPSQPLTPEIVSHEKKNPSPQHGTRQPYATRPVPRPAPPRPPRPPITRCKPTHPAHPPRLSTCERPDKARTNTQTILTKTE